MAPHKRALRQYGSRKRLTSAERLFNLQYRVQARFEQRAKGKMLSNEAQAINENTPEQQSTVASFPLSQDEDYNSMIDRIDAHPCNSMFLDGDVHPAYRGEVGPQVYDPVATYLPCPQSDNIINRDNKVDDRMIITEDVTRKHEIAPDQKPTCQNGPFRFLALEPGIRSKILQLILHRPHNIAPYYNTGSVQVPEHLAQTQNVDTSLLLVNKRLHVEASHILYAQNGFIFTNPVIALWWLKHIGPHNIAQLCAATFVLDSGLADEGFCVRKEKLWLILFTWLRPRHKLRSLVISFRNWRYTREVVKERDRVLLVLFNYRGLERVAIKRSEYIDRDCAEWLEGTMLLKEGKTSPALVKLSEDYRRKEPAYRFRQ